MSPDNTYRDGGYGDGAAGLIGSKGNLGNFISDGHEETERETERHAPGNHVYLALPTHMYNLKVDLGPTMMEVLAHKTRRRWVRIDIFSSSSLFSVLSLSWQRRLLPLPCFRSISPYSRSLQEEFCLDTGVVHSTFKLPKRPFILPHTFFFFLLKHPTNPDQSPPSSPRCSRLNSSLSVSCTFSMLLVSSPPSLEVGINSARWVRLCYSTW